MPIRHVYRNAKTVRLNCMSNEPNDLPDDVSDSDESDVSDTQAPQPNDSEVDTSTEMTETAPAPMDAATTDADPASSDPNPMASKSRAIRPHGLEDGRRLAAAAAQVAIDNNGSNVMVLDVSGQSAEFDFFVLATGTSRRQLHAISEQVDDALEKDLGDRRMGIEGYDESRWIVLDYGSVVIHLFDDETREYYDLESLWADAKPIPLTELGLEP